MIFKIHQIYTGFIYMAVNLCFFGNSSMIFKKLSSTESELLDNKIWTGFRNRMQNSGITNWNVFEWR